MSEPYIVGEQLYRALWLRQGMRIDSGRVAMANEVQFIVAGAGFSTESVSQRDRGDWCRTVEQALEQLLCRLDASLRHAENDMLRIKARIQSTKTMLAHAGQLEA